MVIFGEYGGCGWPGSYEALDQMQQPCRARDVWFPGVTERDMVISDLRALNIVMWPSYLNNVISCVISNFYSPDNRCHFTDLRYEWYRLSDNNKSTSDHHPQVIILKKSTY